MATTTKRLHINLRADLMDAMVELAQAQHRSLTGQVTVAISEHLERVARGYGVADDTREQDEARLGVPGLGPAG